MQSLNFIFTFFVFFYQLNINCQDALPKVFAGRIERVENFKSKYIVSRNVDIWLPQNYSPNEKYAVLYMQDGQMLFDSNLTWNHQSWDVDKIATRLIETNKTRKFIVVGIWNGGVNRHAEYFPEKVFHQLLPSDKDTVHVQLKKAKRTVDDFKPVSNNYLKFIIKELKPFIDKKYSVYKDKENTFIAGSSMGGLISLYAICEYPKIFGGAACLSTHWTGIFRLHNNPIPHSMLTYLCHNLPSVKSKNKFYFDCGDKTLDSLYPSVQLKVDSIMRNKQYSSQYWKTVYIPGANHSEKAWNSRLHIPLEFLLKD